jgi:hypothetical protein
MSLDVLDHAVNGIVTTGGTDGIGQFLIGGDRLNFRDC